MKNPGLGNVETDQSIRSDEDKEFVHYGRSSFGLDRPILIFAFTCGRNNVCVCACTYERYYNRTDSAQYAMLAVPNLMKETSRRRNDPSLR